MEPNQALQVLNDAINEIQRISGLEEVRVVDGTRLLEDIPGFDSLKCVELEILLGERIQRDVEGVVLPRGKGAHEVLTAGEIAKRLTVEGDS